MQDRGERGREGAKSKRAGGRVQWRLLLARSAARSCRRARAPPQTTAAGAPTAARREKKTSRKKDLLAGGDGATSPHRSREGREGEGKKETKRRSNQIQTEGKRTFFVVLGRTELPEIFALYFWNPFNNLSPASRCFAEHDFALFLLKFFLFLI